MSQRRRAPRQGKTSYRVIRDWAHIEGRAWGGSNGVAIDRDGKTVELDASGLYAICIQHEIDHLQGKLFLDRMTDFTTLTQLEEFEKYWRTEHAKVI